MDNCLRKLFLPYRAFFVKKATTFISNKEKGKQDTSELWQVKTLFSVHNWVIRQQKVHYFKN